MSAINVERDRYTASVSFAPAFAKVLEISISIPEASPVIKAWFPDKPIPLIISYAVE